MNKHPEEDNKVKQNISVAKAKLDNPRQNLYSAMHEKRMTMQQLSLRLGKNLAYIHQYLYRRLPKELSFETRLDIEKILEIKEEFLRANADIVGDKFRQRSLPSQNASLERGNSLWNIPVFRDTDEINIDSAESWISYLTVPPTAQFAVWISANHARLRKGDLAFVRAGQIADKGHLVCALLNRRIIGLGEVLRSNKGVITLRAEPRVLLVSGMEKGLRGTDSPIIEMADGGTTVSLHADLVEILRISDIHLA